MNLRYAIEKLSFAALVIIGSIGIGAIGGMTQKLPANSQDFESFLRQPPRYCPENGGSGETLVRYVTKSFYIYICQGGRGRDRNAPDNALDYYRINRQDPNEFLRLSAFPSNNENEYYARGENELHQIDATQLTILENGQTVLTETVGSCIRNDVTLCDGTFLYDSQEGSAFEPFAQWPPRSSELKRFLGRNSQVVAQFFADLDYSAKFYRDAELGKMYVDTGRGMLVFWFNPDTNESIHRVEFH